MSSKLRFVLSALIVAGFTASASADLVTYTFDFSGDAGSDLNGWESASTEVTHLFEGSDLTLRLNASAGAGNTFVQGGGGNFGINNAKFDSGEVMSFDFELLPSSTASNMNFSIVSIGSFGGDNTAILSVNGTPLPPFSGVGSNDNVNVDLDFNLTDDFEFEVGDAGSNGIFLSSFSVQIASVPEPTAFLFGSLVAGSVGAVVARRRKRVA